MFFGHFASDGVKYASLLSGAVPSPGGLVDDNQALFSVNIDREGRTTIWL